MCKREKIDDSVTGFLGPKNVHILTEKKTQCPVLVSSQSKRERKHKRTTGKIHTFSVHRKDLFDENCCYYHDVHTIEFDVLMILRCCSYSYCDCYYFPCYRC